jgi:hypothetical protein
VPQRAISTITARVAVALGALAVAACNSEVGVDEVSPPEGLYAPTCDANATIDFQSGGVAEVNRNYCEGYAREPWDFRVEGDVLTLAPPGKLGDPSVVQEEYEITSPTELTLSSEGSFIACSTCVRGDTWVKQ